MKYEIKPQTIKKIAEAHDNYWDDCRKELYRYKCAYETDFWDKQRMDNEMQMQIQTADAYGYIEGYIASLYSRNPGVIFKQGPRGRGATEKAQALSNTFLVEHRNTIEDASRLSLIYPMSFIKMVPVANPDIYKRVDMMALPPWDIILDRDAKRWKDMRFVAHKYWIPANEAQDKFGNRQFRTEKRKDYFEKYQTYKEEEYENEMQADKMFQYIECVEFYDLVNDQLIFWSPNYADGEKFLDSEIIPFRDYVDEPCIPIIPFYFNRKPDVPLEGYSSMKRIYDQIFETNLIRTFQANAVRKASRQYIVQRGLFDEESMAQITSGIDGLFVEVDSDDLTAAIRPLPQNPTPPELEVYYNQVQADKDKGSIMAPFTRGESTRSSATEIAALAAYTSSEVGRLARERDMTIESIAKVYVDILAGYLDDEKTSDYVIISNRTESVSANDLRENWIIYAQDQAMTPISESVRKREFIQSIPQLQGLGVPNNVLLQEMVRALGLPESFIEEANKQSAEMVSAAKATAAGKAIQPDAAELQQMAQPVGPNNLAIFGGGGK